ncbi:nitroreductase family protein [Thermoproteota archaeon]
MHKCRASRAIKERRSIRSFLDKSIKNPTINTILEAGRWAPSGLNNQPWRFVIVGNKAAKERISECTHYSHIVRRSAALILVFLDRDNSYNLIKDAQAVGACIQNMLLRAFELKVSSCWLGEILNQKAKVNKIINLKSRYDLMAAIALGYSNKKSKSSRLPLKKLVLKSIT